jgi:fluoroquinolone resistance protein
MKSRIDIQETTQHRDFSAERFDSNRYENQAFTSCQFGTIAGIDFSDCVFRDCDLSNVRFNDCKLDNVEFFDCKLIGANFSSARDFGFAVKFIDCNLNYATFDHLKMNQSVFFNCSIHEASLVQTDFTKTKFTNCDFSGSNFSKTNLTGVDLRTCVQMSIDPEENFIVKAKFQLQELPGLLEKYKLTIER